MHLELISSFFLCNVVHRSTQENTYGKYNVTPIRDESTNKTSDTSWQKQCSCLHKVTSKRTPHSETLSAVEYCRSHALLHHSANRSQANSSVVGFFFPSATERAQCASCLVSISPAPHLTDDRRAFFLKPSLSPNKSSKNKSLFTAAACKPTSQYWNISMQIGKQFYTLIWRLYFSPAAIAVTANFNKGNFILNLLYRSINKS